MDQRICKTCGIHKNITEFPIGKRYKGGYLPHCRSCKNEDGKKRATIKRTINPEKLREATRQWRKKNPEKSRISDKYSKERRKEKIRVEQQKWRMVNNGKINQNNKKRRKNPKVKLNTNLSNSIRATLRGNKKGWSWEDLVGYTCEQLREHLEKQFIDGMSWDNYGEWHIDHRTPIAAFNFETPFDLDFRQCWALRNLRPLWAADNMRKKDKLSNPHQPSLLIETFAKQKPAAKKTPKIRQ